LHAKDLVESFKRNFIEFATEVKIKNAEK